jgi:predicted tellurium resistance membrane protein TerC
MSLLADLSDYLVMTPLSVYLQGITWLIPTLQAIHILGIATLFGATFMVAARVLGWAAAEEPLGAIADRFFSIATAGFSVLLATGLLLILLEPARALLNPVFITKAVLLISAVALLLILRRSSVQRAESAAVPRAPSRLVAGLLLGHWLIIIVLGRWIAYV